MIERKIEEFAQTKAGIVLNIVIALFVLGLYPALMVYWVYLNPASPLALPVLLFVVFYTVVFATNLRIEKPN